MRQYTLLVLLSLFPGCAIFSRPFQTVLQPGLSVEKYASLIDTASIWKHLRALAHDSMMGRRPGTAGQTLAVKYISNAFREAGLTAAYRDGYLQTVPLQHAAATCTFTVKNKTELLTIPDSLFVVKGIKDGDINFANTAIVFAGYGVTAPEFGWDDYKNADVKGKIVVVLDREPEQLIKRSFGSGTALTYQTQFNVKDEIAKSHGAAGLILLTEIKKISPSIKWWQQNDFTLLADGLASFQTNMLVRFSQSAAAQFAGICNTSLDRLKKEANDSNFIPFELPANADVRMHINATPFNSYNVVGYIKGSDPELSKECVVYSTHWDGYGIGLPQKGDSIYNAAKDNAGGISEMITIAKAIHSMPKPPGRSIVFIASTAEESGKLGAEAYVRDPIFPLSKTVLAIGMDIFAPWGRSVNLSNASYGYTTVDSLLNQLAKKRSLPYKAPQSVSLLSNSDQYMFARRGVPVVFGGLENGSFLLSDKAVDSIESATPAHSPFDEISPLWNLQSAVDEAKIYFELGVIIANIKRPPGWIVKSRFSK